MPPTLPFGLRKRGVAVASSVVAVGLAAGVAVALPGNGASSVVAEPNARAAVTSAGVQAQQQAAAAKAAAAAKVAAAKAAVEKAAAAKAAAEKAAAEKAAAQKAADRAAADAAAAANRSVERARLAQAAPKATPQAAPQTQQPQQPAPAAPSGTPQEIAAQIVPADQLASFDQIISHESGWNVTATNPSSGAYGLAQALPGSKMASAGPDWQTDAATQIRWALGYMDATYGSPNQAWAFWQANGWY
ncbi:aggregation-promoting factor C-terminal-like domain-containing protein [Streptacidiphilus fuscans]|uniref:Lytic transglycosylase domain-containing protein n=1 Tax=Streptacidiphilus fuscans TaxID=2789292 RepID=A0A931B4E5_9ACTN|nr:lytic transglycosylase domain-containing protein [Streptacidiphilus fuscans]MBF9070104.1 lytic transglycosylase domain-containing protein [Streptacidiphilus fuscans]